MYEVRHNHAAQVEEHFKEEYGIYHNIMNLVCPFPIIAYAKMPIYQLLYSGVRRSFKPSPDRFSKQDVSIRRNMLVI